jgi:hypothetical protein
MPDTYREYPVYDIALVTYSNALTDGGMIRCQAGDIVAVVRALEAVGLKEVTNFLWIRVQGWDSSLMDRLMDSITDVSQADFFQESEIDKTITYEKARFCIPLESLARLVPGFSVERATDPTDIYQPFMVIDHGSIVDFGSTYLDVDVDPYVWLPIIYADEPEVLAAAMAQLTEDSTLTLERTIVEPDFAAAALDAGYFLITQPPVDPDGLIYDKFTQKYLYG